MRTTTVSPTRLALRQFLGTLAAVIAVYAALYGFVALVWAMAA